MTTIRDLLTDIVREALVQKEKAKRNNENFGDEEIKSLVDEYTEIIQGRIIG